GEAAILRWRHTREAVPPLHHRRVKPTQSTLAVSSGGRCRCMSIVVLSLSGLTTERFKPEIEPISPSISSYVRTVAPRSVLPCPLLDGSQACRWFHLWRVYVDKF